MRVEEGRVERVICHCGGACDAGVARMRRVESGGLYFHREPSAQGPSCEQPETNKGEVTGCKSSATAAGPRGRKSEGTLADRILHGITRRD